MSARDITDHRRRVLDHQEVQGKRREASSQPAEPQLTIPLIGEVRRPDPAPPKRKRARMKKPNQPQFRDV
jgi:hypothetical protein